MKKLLKANSLYLGISLLSSSSSILLIPMYISYFSIAEYGELALMNATFALLSIVMTLSIESAFQTFYFDHSEEKLPAYFKSIYSFALLMAIGMTGLMILAGPLIFDFFFSNESISFFPNGLLITATAAISLVNQIYFVLLRNQEKIARYGRFVTISTITSIVLQASLIVLLKQGVTGALTGPLIANALVFLITLKHIGVLNFRIEFKLIKKSLKYCLWLIPFFIVNWFVAKGDRMVVENLMGLNEVGIYALLLNISMVISLLATSVMDSVRPTLFREFKKLTGKLNRPVINISLYFLGVILMACLVLYFVVQSLHHFKVFEDYIRIQEYILLALILFGIRGLVRFVSEYLTFRKKSRDMFFVSLANLLIYGPLLIYFAPELHLSLLLQILIAGNAFALTATIGRCFYLLKNPKYGQ